MFGLNPITLLKFGGVLLIALALGFLWRTVTGWQEKAALVPVLQGQLRDADAAAEHLQRQLQRQQEISNAYQDDLERIRTAERARVPTRIVRLCVSPEVPASGGTAAASGGPHAPGAGDGPSADGRDHPAGPDIGTELYEFADDAAANAAQLTRLQQERAALTCRDASP